MSYEDEIKDIVSKMDVDEVMKRTKEMGIKVIGPEDEGYLGYHSILNDKGEPERIDIDKVFEKMKYGGDL